MKIVLSTVTGAKSEHVVEPNDTVGSLKTRLTEDYDSASLRLCFKGKVLQDDAVTLATVGIVEGSNLVIAGKKKAVLAKSTPPPKPEEVKQSETPAPVLPTATDTTVATPTVTATTSATTPLPTPAAPANSEPTMVPEQGVSPELIDNIVAMGFPDRAEVTRALHAAYLNPDRAVEYLCTEIPATVHLQQSPPHQFQTPIQTPQQSTPAAGVTAADGVDAVAFGRMLQQQQVSQQAGSPLARALVQIPQFPQIRQLIRNSPESLPMVMQQLQEHHPEIFQLVQANPQEFLDLINSGEASGGGTSSAQAQGETQEGGSVGVTIGPQDMEAIERLVSLGGGRWDQQAATVVYVVAQRNEEAAANILFDHGGVPPDVIQALRDGALHVNGGDAGDEDEEAPDE